jgi:hypothetical protein
MAARKLPSAAESRLMGPLKQLVQMLLYAVQVTLVVASSHNLFFVFGESARV